MRAEIVLVALCIATAVGCAAAGIEEPAGSQVHVLTARSFNRFIRRQKLVLMEFYAPWCGHCQELAPQYRKAAAKLHDADLPVPVVLAKMDDTDEGNRALRAGAEDMFNYTSYPSLFTFSNTKPEGKLGEWSKKYENKWYNYFAGGREADEIVSFMSALAKNLDPFEEEKKQRPGLYRKEPDYDPEVVYDLVPENFDEIVLNDDKHVWIVEFYSDRCPFCKSLKPEYIKASIETEKQIPKLTRFGAINSRIFHETAERFDVTGWPWVTSFHKGKKVEDMAGLGGADSVINWAKKIVDMSNPEGGPGRLLGGDKKQKEASSDATEILADDDVESKVGDIGEEGSLNVDSLTAIALKYGIVSIKKAMNIKQGGQDSAAKLYKKMGPLLDLLKKKSSAAAAPAKAAKPAAPLTAGGSWTDHARSNFWSFLHTAAARYPEHPSSTDKKSVRHLVASMAHHFPCQKCAKNIQQFMRNPALGGVAVESRDSLSRWVCELHNLENEFNGQAMFDCTEEGLHLPYLEGCEELKEEEVEYDHHGQVVEKETTTIPHTGPWHPILYAHDPDTFINTVATAMDEWEAVDLDELEQLAMEFNVGTKKTLQQMKAKLRSGKVTREELIEKMKKRLKPVLELRAQAAQARAAA